jgi:hypothetical protein
MYLSWSLWTSRLTHGEEAILENYDTPSIVNQSVSDTLAKKYLVSSLDL